MEHDGVVGELVIVFVFVFAFVLTEERLAFWAAVVDQKLLFAILI